MITYCDINTCKECPRYGDDCDGDKRVEHTDLISRADAIDAVQTYLDILINSRRHGDDFTFINVLTDIRNKISALPSAEAVQGEWEKTTDGNGWNEWHVLKCPLCDATIEDKQNRKWEYNYCPNCGALMLKGGDTE